MVFIIASLAKLETRFISKLVRDDVHPRTFPFHITGLKVSYTL